MFVKYKYQKIDLYENRQLPFWLKFDLTNNCAFEFRGTPETGDEGQYLI